jgi:ubiquinone/menaquinone biosynthesis C-methylase UbiE
MKHEHRKSPFHDHEHAVEFDRRAAKSEIRAELEKKLIDMLALKGEELVLDLATGTGRFARPVAKHITGGRVIGIDQALAMLRVGHEHEDPVPGYRQIAGEAEALPFKGDTFDRAFVSFSLHHFGRPALVAREILRVLKSGGQFVILDPVLDEPRDSLDRRLEERINQVFRRTHGADFRFHSAEGIHNLLTQAGFRIARAGLPTYSFDQDGMEGIPTGRHWLEVAEEVEGESPDLAQRLRERYFRWERKGEAVHVEGSFSYALICGEKPA